MVIHTFVVRKNSSLGSPHSASAAPTRGGGIKKEAVSRIFDKFYQEDESHASAGNGLGLALVKRIAELSDAAVTVQSTPGAGSVFAVTADPSQILLCIILAVPAFAGWILPYFVYKKVKAEKIKKVTPYIEEKYDEIYEICEKGHALL